MLYWNQTVKVALKIGIRCSIDILESLPKKKKKKFEIFFIQKIVADLICWLRWRWKETESVYKGKTTSSSEIYKKALIYRKTHGAYDKTCSNQDLVWKTPKRNTHAHLAIWRITFWKGSKLCDPFAYALLQKPQIHGPQTLATESEWRIYAINIITCGTLKEWKKSKFREREIEDWWEQKHERKRNLGLSLKVASLIKTNKFIVLSN